MNRQRLILFVLTILLGIAVLWSYSAIPRFKTVATGVRTAQPVKRETTVAPKTTPRSADDGTRVNTLQLDKAPSGFKGYHRNIFKPLFIDEEKAVKRSAMAGKQSPVIVPPPAAVAVPVTIQPEAAPLARFTFLGFLKKGSARTIFLAKEKDILLVKKGDTIAERYEASEITDRALTLTVTDTGDQIVIPLIENKPLITAK